jgi:hypothetical protein
VPDTYAKSKIAIPIITKQKFVRFSTLVLVRPDMILATDSPIRLARVDLIITGTFFPKFDLLASWMRNQRIEISREITRQF